MTLIRMLNYSSIIIFLKIFVLYLYCICAIGTQSEQCFLYHTDMYSHFSWVEKSFEGIRDILDDVKKRNDVERLPKFKEVLVKAVLRCRHKEMRNGKLETVTVSNVDHPKSDEIEGKYNIFSP